jgi:hypothetical protein
VKYTEHTRRKTVTALDIVDALKPLSGFFMMIPFARLCKPSLPHFHGLGDLCPGPALRERSFPFFAPIDPLIRGLFITGDIPARSTR